MNYFQRIRETYTEAKKSLEAKLEEGQSIVLCQLEDEEGDYTDEFYELPQHIYVTKHFFALVHYLHTVTKKDGEIKIIGTETEEAEEREFFFGDIDYGTACYICDMILDES